MTSPESKERADARSDEKRRGAPPRRERVAHDSINFAHELSLGRGTVAS